MLLTDEQAEAWEAGRDAALGEVERLRAALTRIYQCGTGPHVEIAREALNG